MGLHRMTIQRQVNHGARVVVRHSGAFCAVCLLVLEVLAMTATLVDANGDSAIHPAWPIRRVDLCGVIAADGPRVETRRVHEVRPRVYALPLDLVPGDELETIRVAIDESKGGALPVRWRHPVDDPPGDADDAPLYRVLNAGAAGRALTLARSAGGVSVRLDLELELLARGAGGEGGAGAGGGYGPLPSPPPGGGGGGAS